MEGVAAVDDTSAGRRPASAQRRSDAVVVFHSRDGRPQLFALHPGLRRVTIGRGPSNHISLSWDTELSRVHAELERVGDQWTIVDEGLSRDGTQLNGKRIRGRTRLRDGDEIVAGTSTLSFRVPKPKRRRSAAAKASAGPQLSATQRKVLEALCRPYKESEFATPASNQAIAEELFLSSDAVKAHLRALVAAFGLDGVPSGQQRASLAIRAMQLGLVD